MFLSGLFSLQNKSHLKYLVEFEERSGNIKTKDSSDLNGPRLQRELAEASKHLEEASAGGYKQ